MGILRAFTFKFMFVTLLLGKLPWTLYETSLDQDWLGLSYLE